ncbi:MAG TPA: hypothetical protein VGR51_05940 [Thermoplasmata archaeon]|nr:hypothetical protein [Thermoplasmata archaeon]
MTDFPTREIREGRASVLVPDVARLKGPGRRSALPFYNPAMAVNRDVTVAVLAAWLPPDARVLDGLAGTGVFGIRAALETERAPAVTWNDKNPAARVLIEKNVERSGLNGDIVEDDLRALLARRRFTYVDIDPFGTALPFIDAAIQQAWRDGAVGITATDTAALAGTYPETCRRRYGARSLRTPCGPETALRIFVGYLVRVAAAHDRGMRVLAAFAAEHFVKAIVAVDPGVRAAREAVSQLGFVRFDGPRFETSVDPPPRPHAGPLWLGPLVDPSLLAGMASRPDTGYGAASIIQSLGEDARLPPFFYENHVLAQDLAVADPVPIASFVAQLRDAGFRVARPYFSPNGVRTDAPWDDVRKAYLAAATAP